jgi:hypothetical protein
VSRGYGKLQWRVLYILSEHEHAAAPAVRWAGLDTLTLAQRVLRREPMRSELVSIRRALATLMRDGKVNHLAGRHEHKHYWRLEKRPQ